MFATICLKKTSRTFYWRNYSNKRVSYGGKKRHLNNSVFNIFIDGEYKYTNAQLAENQTTVHTQHPEVTRQRQHLR